MFEIVCQAGLETRTEPLRELPGRMPRCRGHRSPVPSPAPCSTLPVRALHERLERGSQTGVVSEVWRRAEPFVWLQKRFGHDGNYVFRIVPSKIARKCPWSPIRNSPVGSPRTLRPTEPCPPPLAEQYPGAPRLATRAERSSGAFQRGGLRTFGDIV